MDRKGLHSGPRDRTNLIRHKTRRNNSRTRQLHGLTRNQRNPRSCLTGIGDWNVGVSIGIVHAVYPAPMSKKKDYQLCCCVLKKQLHKKYGKETAAQDFRCFLGTRQMEKDYLRQLKEANKKTSSYSSRREIKRVGEVEIKKRSTASQTNRTCPVCKTYSFSLKDDLYMNRFSCCYECYLDFVIAREDDWKNGNRPSEEQISLSLKRRKKNG